MKSKSGFTIVELLIVIVVIGILAAIIVVVYSGIQQQAKAAQLMGSIDALEKGIRVYKLKNGGYPNPTDVTPSGGATAACVQPSPDNWPIFEGLTASQCYAHNSGIRIGYSSVLKEELQTVVSSIPDTSDIFIKEDGVLYSRGLVYQYWSLNRAALVYFVPSSASCTKGVLKNTVGDIYQCAVEFGE